MTMTKRAEAPQNRAEYAMASIPPHPRHRDIRDDQLERPLVRHAFNELRACLGAHDRYAPDRSEGVRD